ncbi:hypothetical protein Taro_019064 [Colocasia esculenta]|uniref:non-specific serine/threonine protein kinase n=1 Tax=Colocasia esculenta TaxID=4460 RepID=A0A843UY45_COLES|nr:hypothetical protein [Colocasia esculenta]
MAAAASMPPGISAVLLLALLLHRAAALTFNFTSFPSNTPNNISYEQDALASFGVIKLTKNEVGQDMGRSWGRAVYNSPVHLWDKASGELTSFTTRFSFYVGNPPGVNNPGDGLAFFLAPFGSKAPNNSAGGGLALFNVTPPSTAPASIPTVAVEFDTYGNPGWDPYAVHAGIDVNSLASVVNVTWAYYGAWTNATIDADVAYDASTTNLSVLLTGDDGRSRSLSHIVDLREVLPEWVEVGFSASTGASIEIHKVFNWSFQSTLADITVAASPPSLDPSPSPLAALPSPPPEGDGKKGISLVVGGVLAGIIAVLAAAAGIVWFCIRQRRKGQHEQVAADADDMDGNELLVSEPERPKSFPYSELALATRDFAEEGKLGQGGFGSVYRGFLSGAGLEVAVKVSKYSRQGKKEFAAEINIISRLRHRNLVQLVGWCHDRGELLLVYEYMPNGSLDSHLYPREGDGKPPLTWKVRQRVAFGLASALFYLHEECEQCVVHRDVKPSNVILDAGFNAKLGDFGLARLSDHDQVLVTTALAGTMGYLAPECVMSGRTSKESDVYSFGVLALEIACGRRAIEPHAAPGMIGLVDWVWDLYGRGAVLEAADRRLGSDFDELEMERLMLVGLWCAHPDFTRRPSMRQVMGALTFEASLPELSSTMPFVTYCSPPAPAPGESTSSQMLSTVAIAGVSPFTSSGGNTSTSCSSVGSTKTTRSGSSIPPLPL